MSIESFTKLYRSLTKSTVWVGQPAHVKLAWIVMLAEADELGRVTTPVPALAKMAEVTLEEFEKALQVFLDPDPYSRTRDHEGRRIERLAEEEPESGFRLLNHAKYRERRDSERRREQNREAQARWRDKQKVSEDNQGKPRSAEVSHKKPIPSVSGSVVLPDPDQPDMSGSREPPPLVLTPDTPEPADPVRQVFDHWASVVWAKASTREAKFSVERQRVIRARLRSFTVEELCEALSRAAHSDYHLGKNDAGKFYGDVDNLLGSGGKVDKWLASKGPQQQSRRLTGIAALPPIEDDE